MRSRFYIFGLMLFAFSLNAFAASLVIDLRQQDWSPGQVHAIEGNWDFYWMQLIAPQDTAAFSQPAVPFPVPGAWNSPPDGVPEFPGMGYATYRVTLLVPEDKTELTLAIPDMASAYQLWSNGRLVAANGSVGTSKHTETPGYQPRVASVRAQNGELTLVLQTSNYHYQWGGVWYPLQITDAEGAYALREKPIMQAMLSGTVLIAASLFSLLMFASRPKEKVFLFFGLLCLSMGLRRLLIDERIIYFYLGDYWATLQAIENICTYLSFPLFIAYFSYRFPVPLSALAVRISGFVAIPFCVLALTTDVSFYTRLNVPFQLIILAAVPYIIWTYSKVLASGRRGAGIFGLGLAVFSLTVINDILAYSYVIHTPNVAHLGILAFVIFQSTDLARSYFRNFNTIERMSKSLRQQNAELLKLDAFKDEFLATTSHELRTPLHGIAGLASHLLADDQLNLNREQHHKLDLIASTTRRLGSLVNDILDFSGIKHGNLSLRKQSVDLSAVSDNVISTLKPLLAGRDICLSANIDEPARHVWADENRLQQILFNILGNSVKFTEEGFIQLHASRRDEFVNIEISDTGMGIGQSKRDTLFEPFKVEASDDQPYSGNGLGLSISRQLVRQHGGDLQIVSREGYGTTVSFTLPVAAALEVEPAPIKASLPVAMESSTGPLVATTSLQGIENAHTAPASAGEAMIFVVDDDEVNRELVRSQLSKAGYQVESFVGGAPLLSRLQDLSSVKRHSQAQGRWPDLILLDLMMPNISGLSACEQIRQQHDSYQLPIMMLTARYQVADIVACLNAGANDYLIKPYHEKELLARVYSQLNARKFWLASEENQQLKQEIEHRQQLQQDLSIANGRLLQALDITEEQIMLLTEEGEVIYANQAILSLMKTSSPAVIGKQFETLVDEQTRTELTQRLDGTPEEVSFIVNDATLGGKVQLSVRYFEEKGEGYYAVIVSPLQTHVSAEKDPAALSRQLIDDLTQEIAASRHKFEQIEQALKQVTTLRIEQGTSPANAEADSHPQGHVQNQRELLVKLLRETLGLWERYTHRTKADLAEESRCWRVYIDGTTAKTRTLDRYLSERTLPEKPRWRLGIRTAKYVIDHCALSTDDYQVLSDMIDALDKAYS
ncbi:MAG: response regulator [Hahellaceae bacterium]|nr:response regulator [Hahellaceae bacterium]MCP5210359.1 response regulator [Hahellaceae bacterium]